MGLESPTSIFAGWALSEAMILAEWPSEHHFMSSTNGFPSSEQRPDSSGAMVNREFPQSGINIWPDAHKHDKVAGKDRLRFAMVCASNQNRSMAAHALLFNSGLSVSSYGTGSQVKLPGPSQREPNIYSFGTPYQRMHDDLAARNPSLYPFSCDSDVLSPNL